MLFLGTFMGGDVMSIPCAPTECADINSVKIENGKYDNLYITKNVIDTFSPIFPDGWDFDTILYAKFDDSANAGNVDWGLETVSHILVKRREKNSFNWRVLEVRQITKKEDFNFQGIDYTNAAKTEYEYAVVPSFHGIEGNYDSIIVYSDFDDIFLVSQNGVIHTCLTDGYCDVTKNKISITDVTLYDKYPYKINSIKANYITGTFTGSFVSYSSLLNDYVIEDKQRIKYQNDVMSFLSDNTPKLYKHFDSSIYLVSIDDAIQNNANGHYQNKDITFNFTEIGDVDSAKDLYVNGISNVTEEWW